MKIIVRRQVPDGCSLIVDNAVLQEIYSARGVRSISEVNYSLQNLLPFSALEGIDKAVACLKDALIQQKKVLIIGDYDVDGATSTALALKTLQGFGLKNISYLIPNRFEFGYGLTPEIVQLAAAQSPDLIITVDNGISSFAGVIEAKKQGIEVLITDHHLPSNEVPEACAIVNPNQHGDKFPSKNLAGVGVVFYLMLALRSRLRNDGWFTRQNIAEPNMGQYLDFVALGTVADLVSLDYNNRILVSNGLKNIRAGRCCIGIKTLLSATNRDYERITASDLAYAIAPKLNAAGRLEDMSLGVECLLTDSLEKARQIANQLNILNSERREIEESMRKQAWQVLQNFSSPENLPLGLCVFDESWHQGIIGILASRIKDKFNRPTIAFASVNDSELKGSARSVPGLHIRDLLENIAARYPDLISKFGGHAMAAGLSLRRENYALFCDIFSQEIDRNLKIEDLANNIYTDGALSFEHFSLEFAETLHQAGPWGCNFPEPLFDGTFEIAEQRLVGRKHLKLAFRLPGTLSEVSGIYFNIDTEFWPNQRCAKVRAAYRLDANEYNGRRFLQLIVEYMEALD